MQRLMIGSLCRVSVVRCMTQAHAPVQVHRNTLCTTCQQSATFKPNRGTGDAGSSSLYTNERRWKDEGVFEALGCVDELTCALGLARQTALDHATEGKEHIQTLALLLYQVQCSLQDLNSHVATPTDSKTTGRTAFDEKHVAEMDRLIDEHSRPLPPLTTFILPGGGRFSCELHIARAKCRAAERRLATLLKQEAIDTHAFTYLNRLSDLLFVLARRACQLSAQKELSYQKPHPL